MKKRIDLKYFLFVALSLLISCGNQSSGQKEVPAVKSSHPEWAYNAVIYEVNTRQYTPEGTFRAFSAHLPRLKELGVDILWFMPSSPLVRKTGKVGWAVIIPSAITLRSTVSLVHW